MLYKIKEEIMNETGSSFDGTFDISSSGEVWAFCSGHWVNITQILIAVGAHDKFFKMCETID
jgi:hypothetical protein